MVSHPITSQCEWALSGRATPLRATEPVGRNAFQQKQRKSKPQPTGRYGAAATQDKSGSRLDETCSHHAATYAKDTIMIIIREANVQTSTAAIVRKLNMTLNLSLQRIF